jgi:hypothetical protein
MSANDQMALVVSLVTIIASFIASVRWLVKHYLNELKPNSGTSLRDSLDRLEKRVDDLFKLIAEK